MSLKNAVKTLAIVTTVGMFLVLVMGAAVTNTGSEQGCGHSWPLCRGQLIPQMAVKTAIEFSHRAIVGVVTPLILALAGATLYLYPRRVESRVLAALMVGFLFAQAGLGAWAVMYPQLSAVLALHFGVSLISFASVLLTTIFIFEADGAEKLRDRPIPERFRWAAWGVAAYSYVVIYLGAYVRHTNADDTCRGWPACKPGALPSLTTPAGTNMLHRFAAGLLMLGVIGLVLWSYRLRGTRPDLFWATTAALVSVLLQASVGVVVVLTRVDLFSALAHAAMAGVLFGSLAYLCAHVLPRWETARQAAPKAILASSGADPATIRR
jgi:heme a synthase